MYGRGKHRSRYADEDDGAHGADYRSDGINIIIWMPSHAFLEFHDLRCPINKNFTEFQYHSAIKSLEGNICELMQEL